MRATLIHNPKAGDRRLPECVEMVAALEDLGWKVRPMHKRELEDAIKDPGDVIVVAGGDGTVGKVAKRLAGTRIPMAVIPTGTANNVARTLGIGVHPRSAIDGLARSTIRDVDLGVVQHASGEEQRFLEGFGVGVFAYVMAERASKKHKKLRRAFQLLAKELETYAPYRLRLEIDGQGFSDRYLMVAVMNLRSLGPALGLAPTAEFDDGQLDVVLVRPEDKDSLVAHLRRAALEGDIALPNFEHHRAKNVRLGGAEGKWSHADDCARELDGSVEIRVDERAVRFVVPQAE